jgi:hypothetical protein
VEISEASLHSMIAGFPALRELHLFRVHNLHRLAPSSRNLVDIYIRPHVPFDEVSFRGTPNLEKIVFQYADIWRLCSAERICLLRSEQLVSVERM